MFRNEHLVRFGTEYVKIFDWNVLLNFWKHVNMCPNSLHGKFKDIRLQNLTPNTEMQIKNILFKSHFLTGPNFLCRFVTEHNIHMLVLKSESEFIYWDFNMGRLFSFVMFDYKLLVQIVLYIFAIMYRQFYMIVAFEINKLISEPPYLLISERNLTDEFTQGDYRGIQCH